MNTDRPPSFPPVQPLKVFVPASFPSHHHDAMKAEWLRWGGESEFTSDPNEVRSCGVCLFTQVEGLTNHEANCVRPFFEKHGSEANVFEYRPKEKTFWRINPAWLATYYPA